MGEIEIYGLYCPISRELRYVGKSVNGRKRLKSHLWYADKRKTPLYEWMLELREKKFIPVLNVLAVVSESDWEAEERRLIRLYRNQGTDLLNVAAGGNQPFCPIEVRKSNGRRVAKAIHDNPKAKRFWHLKKMLGSSLAWLKKSGRIEKHDQIVNRLRAAGLNF